MHLKLVKREYVRLSSYPPPPKKGDINLWELIDIFITLFVAIVSNVFMHMPKLIKMYTLNMCSVLYIKYVSIELKK